MKKKGEKICCPCKTCGNMGTVSNENELRDHIFCNGFLKNYTEWVWHGEGILDDDINYDDNVVGLNNVDDDYEDNQLEEMLHDMEENMDERGHVFIVY